MGVVVRRYIDILTISINFSYSTGISSFFSSSIPTSLFIFKNNNFRSCSDIQVDMNNYSNLGIKHGKLTIIICNAHSNSSSSNSTTWPCSCQCDAECFS